MRVVLQDSGQSVSLTDKNFVAQGGEGAVYVVGDRAVKIYTDARRMIPEGKLAELTEVATPSILAPLGAVLRKDDPVGYSMTYADSCLPLPKIYPRAWREANRFDPDVAVQRVLELRGNVVHVHDKGCLFVDLNDMNLLASGDGSALLHIDVDSIKTPSYPPTAVMASVRDPHMTGDDFTTETDWYAMALLAFSIMVGTHPFKGTHPDYTPRQLLDRMRDGVSALMPEVMLPKPCMPLDVIPDAWRKWFEGVFHKGDRSAPPVSAEVVALVVPAMIAARAGDLVMLSRFINTGGRPVVHLCRTHKGLMATLADGTFMINHEEKPNPAPDAALAAVGVTPRMRRPVGFYWARGNVGWLQPYDLESGERIGDAMRADAAVSSEAGLVHLRLGEDLLEMRYIEGRSMRVVPERIGSVAPHATHLFSGVAIQSLLGTTYVSLLPKAGRCVQIRLNELDGHRIVDARFVGGRGEDGKTGVLVVVVEKGGKIDVHTWSGLHPSGRFEHHEVDADVAAHDIDLVELDTGVCVSAQADGSLKLFKPGRADSQSLKDDALLDARLLTDAGTLYAAFNDGLYTAKMK